MAFLAFQPTGQILLFTKLPTLVKEDSCGMVDHPFYRRGPEAIEIAKPTNSIKKVGLAEVKIEKYIETFLGENI